MGRCDANIVGHIVKVQFRECREILARNLSSRMFSTKCLSPGFSRFLSATTTHVAQSLKGTPAVVIPVVDTVVQSPPATLTTHSLAKIVPTGNLVATTKHFGKKRFSFSCLYEIESKVLLSGVSCQSILAHMRFGSPIYKTQELKTELCNTVFSVINYCANVVLVW